MENKNTKKVEASIQQKATLSNRLKAMKPGDIVSLVLETLLFILMMVISINFIYDLANGISFISENYHGYEIGITIFLCCLDALVLFQIIYDFFFKNYLKIKTDRVEKVIRNGRVISLTKDEETK